MATRTPRSPTSTRARPARQQGSILVLTLLVCLVLLGLGLTAMWLSTEGGTVSTNISRRGEAFFAAQSGLERGRGILLAANTWDQMLQGCGGPQDDTGRGRVLCAGGVPLQRVRLFNTATSGGQVGSLNTVEYTVWVRNDDEEGGAGSFTDANFRVILRAEGTARNNQGLIVLEQVIGRGGGGSLPEAAYSQAGMGPTGAGSGRVALGN